MFAYEPPLDPPCDYFKEYAIPERIQEICEDILKYGSSTSYQNIYDYLYETAEDDLLYEREQAYAE